MHVWWRLAAIALVLFAAPAARAQDAAAPKAAALGEPPGGKRLVPEYDVWIDPERRLVIMDGVVCLREGQLELLACPRGTKEHETVVSVNTKAFVVHAALLTIGAENGKPVQFAPTYTPATGTEIDVYLLWIDAQGVRHKARAQEWVRNAQSKKEMEYSWVFAGSGFWKDEASGKMNYEAEAGDLICVSNFSSAMLDLPVASPQANDGLLFEAFTERIPPLDTKVRIVLAPKLNSEAGDEAGDMAEEAK